MSTKHILMIAGAAAIAACGAVGVQPRPEPPPSTREEIESVKEELRRQAEQAERQRHNEQIKRTR